jgi:hypothetical protein
VLCVDGNMHLASDIAISSLAPIAAEHHLLVTTISGPRVSIHVAHSVRVAFEAARRLSKLFWCKACKITRDGSGCNAFEVGAMLSTMARC